MGLLESEREGWTWLKVSSSGHVAHALDEKTSAAYLKQLTVCGREVKSKSLLPGTAGMLRCLKCLHVIGDERISHVIPEEEDLIRVERERSVRLYRAMVDLIGMHRTHPSAVGGAGGDDQCHWLEPDEIGDHATKKRLLGVVYEEGIELARLGYLE